MRKGLVLFVALMVMGSFVFADEIDEEIKRLEKETKLLELQNKKTKLEKRKNTAQDKDLKKSLKKVKNPKLKNGFFVGIEGGVGKATISNTIKDSEKMYVFYPKDNTTFDLGLVIGHQHYFGNSQKHGIKTSAHVYSGFGNSFDISSSFPTGNISYIPVKFGFDIKYLWDFYQSNKHIIGLNTGLGWEFDWYVFGEASVKYDLVSKYAIKEIFIYNIYPVIGLHYYYGHHQFELMYRFGKNKGESLKTFGNATTLNTSIQTQNYVAFNYVYRF